MTEIEVQVAPDYDALARNALPLYGMAADSGVTLINHSENLTYRVDEPSGGRSILRVHRPGYQTRESILSEIAWMKALQEDVGIQTPQALAGLDGELLQSVSTPEFSERFCVRFEWIEGEVPKETDALDELLVPFEQLGELNARLHEHSRGWQAPPAFSRQRWDFDGTIGADPIWGSFRACPVLTAENHRLLDRTVEVMAGRLGVFGDSRQRFGLIHADVRLANLMFHEGNIRVVDFDDSGFGWYLYDLGAALSFMEDRDDVPLLVDAWVRGYRKVTSLPAVEKQELTTFIMLRRLVLLGWIGSRAESDLAQEMQDGFARGTCMLAERYLSRFA